MSNQDEGRIGRRSLIAGIGVAAAGMAAGTAAGQGRNPGFMPARHASDAWMDELPGRHRVWIDTSYGLGGMEALHYSNNILTAHGDVNEGADADYAVVICWRHYATPLGYHDSTWEKYGKIFSETMGISDPATGSHFRKNPANLADRDDLDNGGDTIDKMRGRGVQFALCNAATRWYSGYVAGQVENGDRAAIYEEFVAAAIPNSRFVHAGVFATTRAQEYGYSLLYAG